MNFLYKLEDIEPELYALCVPECVYRGYCPEMFKCDFIQTKHYGKCLYNYRNYNGEEEKNE